MAGPALIFGGGQIGDKDFKSYENSRRLFGFLAKHGISHFDSAALYPVVDSGRSEDYLGRYQKDADGEITVDTKIALESWSGSCSLGPDLIRKSIETSNERLPKGINILYPHTPDSTTPWEQSHRAFDEAHRQGKFKLLGLSNYDLAQVTEAIETSGKHGLVKPSVLQNQYNAIHRGAEKEMLPLLRKHGLRLYAYSPLAGGILLGNLTAGNDVTGTRLQHGTPGASMYRGMFDTPECHAAISKLVEALRPHGISLPEASLRWLRHHSALQEGDAILLGASRFSQVEETLAQIVKGPLPQDVVDAFESAWQDIDRAQSAS